MGNGKDKNEDKKKRGKTLFFYRNGEGQIQKTEPPPYSYQKIHETEAEFTAYRHTFRR
jgi:hypothetical protein